MIHVLLVPEEFQLFLKNMPQPALSSTPKPSAGPDSGREEPKIMSSAKLT